MQYDPYAAPQHTPPPPPGGATPAQGPQFWEMGEALGVAWRAFTQNAVVLIFAPLLAGLIIGLPLVALGAVGIVVFMPDGLDITTLQRPESRVEIQAGLLALQVVALVVQSFFEVGLIRIYVAAARGETPGFSLLFSGGSRYAAMLGLKFLLQLPTLLVGALGVTAIALGDPGLIIGSSLLNWVIAITMLVLYGLGLLFSWFFVADGDSGPIQSLKDGWGACAGQRGSVFLFAFVAGLIAVAGVLACCIGAVVSTPLAYVALAVVYTRLTGRGPGMATPQGPPAYGTGYGGPPPPGFGPPAGGGYGGPPGYPPPGGGYPPPGGSAPAQ